MFVRSIYICWMDEMKIDSTDIIKKNLAYNRKIIWLKYSIVIKNIDLTQSYLFD